MLDGETRRVLPARDDDVLAAVHDRDVPVRVPDGEVARVEVAATESFAGRLGVLKVFFHDDIPAEYDLAHRLAVLRHVDQRRVRAVPLLRRVDNPRLLGRGEGDALPCDELGALFERVSVPGWLDVTLR